MLAAETEHLEALAAAVLDGHGIDWAAEESSAGSDALRSAIRHLRVLHDVAGLHGPVAADADRAIAAPSRWGHLRVLEPLGRGSFGEVFRAWDETLDREVALKLLPDAGDAIQEARALARVSHFNVVSVYGAERREGRVGLWMEYIQGRTLSHIVRDQGPFGAHEAIPIGIDICRSAAAVHAAGLLHRDIKAQNVMRAVGGRIVLMDLGTWEDRGVAPLRENSALAGTPMYMAPEVLAGRPASVQSDVYSIGVLLFYLVTGTYPVAGQRLSDLRGGNAPRRHLRDLRPDLPEGLVAVIERASASDRGERFATAGAVEAALRAAAGSPASKTRSPRHVTALALGVAALASVAALGGWIALRPPPPGAHVSSIVVLPFQDVSSDGRAGHVADGVAAELIQSLSGMPSLRVISRTSSAYYKEHPKPLADIARELNVDAVVEGSVRTSGGRIQIDARLIDPRTDHSMWSRSFEEDEAKIAAVEDELARALGVALSRPLAAGAPRRVDPAAYDLYLQGRYQLFRRTPEALRAARDLLDRAIERDPSYAPSHAGLAEAYTLLGAFGVIPRVESYSRGRQAANDALRLDDRQSMPYAVLGYITYEADRNVPLAFDHFRAAIARNRNNGTAHQWYALSLCGQSRCAEGLEEIERARAVDPLSKSVAADAGNLYRVAGNPEKAREHLRVLVSLDPEFAEGRRQLGLTYLDLQDYANAVTEFEAAIALAGPAPYLLGDLGYAYARLGRAADANRVVATLHSQSKRQEQWYWALTSVNGGLGKVREAVDVVLACRKRLTDCAGNLNRPGLEAVLRDPRVRAALGIN